MDPDKLRPAKELLRQALLTVVVGGIFVLLASPTRGEWLWGVPVGVGYAVATAVGLLRGGWDPKVQTGTTIAAGAIGGAVGGLASALGGGRFVSVLSTALLVGAVVLTLIAVAAATFRDRVPTHG
jgi:hypothetical protein